MVRFGRRLRNLLKRWLRRALGKTGQPVVAVFLSGDEQRSRAMALRMRELVPEYPHVIIGRAPVDRAAYPYADEIIELETDRALAWLAQLRRRLRRRWIALAPFLWRPAGRLRWMPWLVAPRKLLAFNSDLERHHLRLRAPIASWRFLRGERVGDIFRPTALAGLRKAGALIGFPLLLACWAATQLRRGRAAPMTAAGPAALGTERVVLPDEPDAAFWESLDRTAQSGRAEWILVASPNAAAAAAERLEAEPANPEVWLAYLARRRTALSGGIPVEDVPKTGESGAWALCGRPACWMFRRDVYLLLGGSARLQASYPGQELLALSLLGWQRGYGTVFAGEAEQREARRWPEAGVERLILGVVSEPAAVFRILWRWAWSWRRWSGALAAMVDTAPAPLPERRAAAGGNPAGWLQLVEPGVHVFAGRRPIGARRVAVVSPYLPFPLAHGGAIRIFNLLREAARQADVYLFAFAEQEKGPEVAPLLGFCARVILVQTPRWEPSRLLRVLPRGVGKFQSPVMESVVGEVARRERIGIVQMEYSQLAGLGARLDQKAGRTVLVAHDVTFDLYRQLRGRSAGGAWVAAAIEELRWRRHELGRARRYDRVIVMSDEDKSRLARAGLTAGALRVVENGVDLARFRPAPPAAGPPEALFIGSFRHFPNLLGYRFLVEEVWPELGRIGAGVRLTVVAGADPDYYWRLHTGEARPAPPPGVEVLAFVEDVRPLYERAAVVVAPLVVSAGTNVKVLEALAMERALVSTTAGVAGLGLTSGQEVLLADAAKEFAAAVLALLDDPRRRAEMAARGRAFVEARYGWDALASKLLKVWEEL